MQKHVTTVLFTTLFVSVSLAQQGTDNNLVMNPGFEEVTKKITSWDQIDRAMGWSNANMGSIDMFSKDASVKNVGIPANEMGVEDPADGEFYAGFMAWKANEVDKAQTGPYYTVPRGQEMNSMFSEYLQVQLWKPLEAGKEYVVTFKVSLSEESDRAVSGIGAMTSEYKLKLNHRHFVPDNPLIYSKEIIEKRDGWHEIKGYFKALGDEKYLIIGAFPGAGMDVKAVVVGPDSQRAYYYIDSVSLSRWEEPDQGG